MKKLIPISGAAIVALLAVSCAPQTPAYRISMRPAAFEGLSEKNKELVRNGEIAKGMGKDAVLLAWGSPAGRVDGLKNGKTMERWDYRGTKPVVTHNIYGGFGSGRYGPYRYSGIGGGFGPEVSYLPYRKGSVWFLHGKVDEWERIR